MGVDAGVLPEAAVLEADGRADDPRVHFVQRQIGAVTAERARVEALVKQVLAGAVEDAHRFELDLFGLDGAGVGQVAVRKKL